MQGDIYIHRRGAFSVARFDNPGNAKAFTALNGHQDWLHAFFGSVDISGWCNNIQE